MRKTLIVTAALLGLAACNTVPGPPPPPSGAHSAIPAAVATAIADPSRPDADRAKDVNRKPGDTLAFAGVRPGMKVADLVPGGGYFTRLLAKTVGPKGRVYAYVPDELTKIAKREPAVNAIAAEPGYGNVKVILRALPQFGAPEKLDVVFTAQNYHDMHDSFMGPADLSVVNAQVYRALKPGGVYVIIDHSAKAGSGLRDTETLHRIDSAGRAA